MNQICLGTDNTNPGVFLRHVCKPKASYESFTVLCTQLSTVSTWWFYLDSPALTDNIEFTQNFGSWLAADSRWVWRTPLQFSAAVGSAVCTRFSVKNRWELSSHFYRRGLLSSPGSFYKHPILVSAWDYHPWLCECECECVCVCVCVCAKEPAGFPSRREKNNQESSVEKDSLRFLCAYNRTHSPSVAGKDT